jgi:hypothetical protein
MIDAEIDQAIVAAEVALRRELYAHEHPDLLLDRADEGLGEFETMPALKATVQMHERDAGFGLRRPAGFDYILDGLLRDLGAADVLARRAEPAIQSGRPEFADRVDVDPEVGPLEDADSRHRNVARRQPAIPRRLRRDNHRIARTAALVENLVRGSLTVEHIR